MDPSAGLPMDVTKEILNHCYSMDSGIMFRVLEHVCRGWKDAGAAHVANFARNGPRTKPHTPRGTVFFDLIAKEGYNDLILWAHKHGCPARQNAYRNASGTGRLETIKLMRSLTVCEFAWTEMCELAAENGHVALVEWCLAEGCTAKWPKVCSRAALGGHLKIIQSVLAHQDNFTLGKWTLCNAALRGHNDIIEWLMENCAEDQMEKSVWQHAVDGDQSSDDAVIVTLELLKRYGFPKTRAALSSAAKRGRMKVIEWLVANKFGFYPLYLIEAAASGSKDAVKFGLANGFTLTKVVVGNAAMNNQAEMVRWLLNPEMACPFDEQVIQGAAKNGDLELLQFLLDSGVEKVEPEWHESAIVAASQGGHLEVIDFTLRAFAASHADANPPKVLKIPPTACEAAVIYHHEEVLRWLVERGAEWPIHSQMAALLFGLWTTVVWAVNAKIFDKGLLDDIGVVAARLGRIDVLEWVLGFGRKQTKDVVKQAVLNQNLDLLRWLRRHRPIPLDDPAASEEPAEAAREGVAGSLEHETSLDTAGLVLSDPDEPRWSGSD